jgi:hypothetical protein
MPDSSALWLAANELEGAMAYRMTASELHRPTS